MVLTGFDMQPDPALSINNTPHIECFLRPPEYLILRGKTSAHIRVESRGRD